MSIKQILLITVVGLLVVTVSTIMVSTYTSTQKVLISHAHQIMETVSEEAIDRSISFLKPAELAAQLTQKLANHNVVSKRDSEAMERYFFEQLRLYPQFSGIYFATTNDDFIYVKRDDSYTDNGYLTKVIENGAEERSVSLQWRDSEFRAVASKRDDEDRYVPSERPWYRKALQQNRLVWTEPYIFFTSQQPGITISSPVRDADTDRSAGVVGVDIEISDISSFLARLKIGENGSAFIIDTRGQVLAHPDAEKIKQAADHQAKFTQITEIDDPLARAAFRSLDMPLASTYILDHQRITRFFYKETAYQAVFTPFQQQKWPWIIGIYVPEKDYVGAFQENQQQNILLGLAIAILASLLGYGVSRSLIKPIIKLGKASRAVMQGNWDYQGEIKTRYLEIRQTAQAFDAMTQTLREQKKQNEALNKTLLENSLATIFRLAEAAEYKNPMPSNHLSRMAQLSSLIARSLEQDKHYCEMILYAAPLHDIGNLGIPDNILLKPGKLDRQEWESVKEHPLIGAEILKNPETEMLAMARRIILAHHEKWNGYGYPNGLAGNDIPLEARICAIADTFDTIVSERVYKPAYELDQAFREIKTGKGSHFDPLCVDALMRVELEVRRLYSNIPNVKDIF